MPCRPASERFGRFLHKQPEDARTQVSGYAQIDAGPRVRFIRSGEMPFIRLHREN